MAGEPGANVFKCPTCRIVIKHQRRESLDESVEHETAIEMLTEEELQTEEANNYV
jgi:hypothetical protein